MTNNYADILKACLEANNRRDLHVIERFCDKGAYLDKVEKEIVGVCKPVEINELLNVLHNADERLMASIKKLLV